MYVGGDTGVLQIKDIPHAIDKDCRSLFALDNLKQQSRRALHDRNSVLEPYAVNYYGDITGPCELQIINKANTIFEQFVNEIESDDMVPDNITPLPPTSSISHENSMSSPHAPRHSVSMSRSITKCNHMLQRNCFNTLHVSHYSFEWILNVNDTVFTEEMKADGNATNFYLIGTYQKTMYDKHMSNEFITMGLTSNISFDDEQYKFYVEDFLQDLIQIQNHTPWIYENDIELPMSLWSAIITFIVDCVLPVEYEKTDENDEIKLNDGYLHLILKGSLKSTVKRHEEHIKYLGEKFAEFGKMVDKEYARNKSSLRSEYNKWKKQSFKKRQKPLSMNDLSEKLRRHDSTSNKHRLYYNNPNFKLSLSSKLSKSNRSTKSAPPQPSKHRYSKSQQPKSTKMANFRKLFTFGASKKSRNKTESQLPINMHGDLGSLDDMELITRAKTDPSSSSRSASSKKLKQKKKKKKKGKKRNAYREYDEKEHLSPRAKANGFWSTPPAREEEQKYEALTPETKDTASLPVFSGSASAGSANSAGSGSRSHGPPQKTVYSHPNKTTPKAKAKKDNVEDDGFNMINLNDLGDLYGDGDVHADGVLNDLYDTLPGSSLKGTQSDDSHLRKKPVKLKATMKKPQHLQYTHEANEVVMLDGYQSNMGHTVDTILEDSTTTPLVDEMAASNAFDDESGGNSKGTHKRAESLTVVRVKDEIRSAYQEYEVEKGRKPDDVQSFVTYCTRRKNIKKANWSYCKEIMQEMK